ncbi:VgrG protein [Minicystis rosea]|nr:VgrG protein [Minicystis rosea]
MPFGFKRNPVPDVKVTIGGTVLPPDAQRALLDVGVQDDVDAASMFTLRFLCWDAEKLNLMWSDDRRYADRFALGTEVAIELGYKGKLAEVMVGEITGVDIDVEGQRPTMTVRGYDGSHRMSRATRTRSFADLTDAGIAAEIARDYGLTAEGTSDVKHPYVMQYNQTDLEFLRQRADLIAYEVMVQQKTLRFRPRSRPGPPAFSLSMSTDILGLHLRLTARDLVDKTEARGWDQKEKKAIVGRASAAQDDAMGGGTVGAESARAAFSSATAVMVNVPVSTQAEADQIARAALAEQDRGFLTGEGICYGRADLVAGITVDITNFGRFGGPYEVVSTEHTYAPKQGYRTRFTVRRNAV